MLALLILLSIWWLLVGVVGEQNNLTWAVAAVQGEC
jgi:hypothetical protein